MAKRERGEQNIERQSGFLFLMGMPLLVALALVAGLIFFWYGYTHSNEDFAKGQRYIVTITPGMTTKDIAELLHEKHLVKTPEAFRMEARVRGLATKLRAGKYEIIGGMSNGEIVDVLSKGQVHLLKFTVPEGFTIVKTAKKLEAEGLGSAEQFIEAAKDYAPYPYMETDNQDVKYKAEGFIYPSTYLFEAGATEKDLLMQMVREFNSQINKAGLPEECEKKNISVRDMVNIASMVEMEAVFADEQPRIAGVFFNRLELGMPIQSDTTIQYILGRQKTEILISDTKIPSAYNTYLNAGLPPGPIACPSLQAMQAVMHPEKHDFLYFVAERDGHHRFTRTYGDHLQAIENIDAQR